MASPEHIVPSEGGRQTWTCAHGQQGSHFQAGVHKMILPGPKYLVWKPLACSILRRAGGFGLATSLFLLDLNFKILRTSQTFTKVFLMYRRFLRRRGWIVRPLCIGCSINQWFQGDGLQRKAHLAPLSRKHYTSLRLTLGQVLELARLDLDNGTALASHMGVMLSRRIQQLLYRWKSKLSGNERAILRIYIIIAIRKA